MKKKCENLFYEGENTSDTETGIKFTPLSQQSNCSSEPSFRPSRRPYCKKKVYPKVYAIRTYDLKTGKLLRSRVYDEDI